MKNFYKKGITFIEILIAVSILSVLFAIILPQFSKIKENQILKNTVGDIVSVLHSAQSQSMSSVNSIEYGVHFQADKIIVFKGKIFSSDSTDNRTTNLILPASISNVTLGGVSSISGDIYFDRLNGTPSKVGTINVSTPSISKIITVSAAGAVSVN